MKLEYKIPKGWRRVRRGKVKQGDRFDDKFDGKWVEIGRVFTGTQIQPDEIVIRRIKKGGRRG